MMATCFLLHRRITTFVLVVLMVVGVCAVAAGEMVTDVIVGRNSKGPYALSWTNIDPSSVVVVVNGLTLKKGEKYNIDYAKGMISFTSVVLNDAIVRVSYSTIPGKSQRNPAKVTVPVTLSLFQRPDANLQVTGLYAQDDPNKPDSGKTIVGMGGEKSWTHSKLSSQFFLSQRNDNDRTGGQASAWDRSAFRLGSQTRLGAFTFGGSMLYAGREFAGGNETGLGQGKRASDLTVSFSPSSKLQASAAVRESEETAGQNAGSKSVTHEQSVIVAPSDDTKVALTRSTTETSTAIADSQKTVETTGVKIDQKIGANVGASVEAATTTVSSAKGSEKTQSQAVALQSNVVSAQVNLTQKESVGLNQASTTDVKVEAKLGGNTQVQGRVVNTENVDSTAFQRDVKVLSKPVEFVTVEAAFSQKGTNENEDVIKAARVEVSPFSHTRLSAGVKYLESGPTAMKITDFGASTKPVGLVSFSGSLRRRETTAGDAPDSAAMQVSLAPVRFMTITGGYQSNPEDNQGRVQSYNATDLGLKLRFGSVGVTTGYVAKNEYAVRRLSEEKRIGLELQAFGGGTLTTGYKISRVWDGSTSSSNTFSLGYKRELGSSLNVSLTGYYTQYLKDRAVMRDKTEYSAEASLGIRF